MKKKIKVAAGVLSMLLLVWYGFRSPSFPLMGYFMILVAIYGALCCGLKGGLLFSIFTIIVFFFSFDGSFRIFLSASATILIIGILAGKFKDVVTGQRDYNRALLKTVPGMVALHTTEGDFLDIVGSKSFLEGENIDQILPDRVSEKIKKGMKKAQIHNKIETVEYQLKVKGEVEHYEAKINYFKENKALVHINEITKRKELEEKLRLESNYDSLTGIHNRSYAEKILYELDEERDVGLVLIDVNGLKMINDVFGHIEGDRLLSKVAKILERSCRKEDCVARWGGDEFLLILPNTKREEVNKVIKRIERNTKREEVEFGRPISFAIGIATKRKKEDEIFDLVGRADDRMYDNKLQEGKSAKERIIRNILNEIEDKGIESKKHRQRIIDLSIRLGKEIGLSDLKIENLKQSSKFHDIGKVTLNSEVVDKRDKLTMNEWEQVKKHCKKGHQILASCDDFLEVATDVLHHHEWWDGSGYPNGLKGEDIPINSRIISLIDSYVVMLDRFEKREDAMKEIKNLSGKQFDPNLVTKFIEVL